MLDTKPFEALILKRLAALGHRIEEIDAELGHEMSRNLEEQAVDIEDDEVLEGLGLAAQQEVALLNAALKRIGNGTYGICQTCGEQIAEERLRAVPFTPVCRQCARGEGS